MPGTAVRLTHFLLLLSFDTPRKHQKTIRKPLHEGTSDMKRVNRFPASLRMTYYSTVIDEEFK